MARIAFVAQLGVHGDRPAVAAPVPASALTYAELAVRVSQTARALGTQRRLVLIQAVASLDCLVTYLAALHAGHVVLLAPGTSPAAFDALRCTYDPDVVALPTPAGWATTPRRTGSAHRLHPDLALLLVTSGSSGSPKLVRLSHANLQANAESVAASLGIGPTDRGITSLPLSYCYGLSVVHSHLLRGGSLVVADRSVTEDRFWDDVRGHEVTNLAGVPYTFDLLERIGLDTLAVPSLRLVTQAGGRLDPDRVRRYAALGQSLGWDFVVMYGQTEATARMAVLPPALATTRPQSVGHAVPGGRFRIDLADPGPADPGPADSGPADPGPGEPPAPHDVGEIVYEGPNVMLGYARDVGDLALGRTVTELRTGDLGRIAADGLLEITGRRSALLKIFGTRVDLEHVDALLASVGVQACSTGTDDRLDVAVEGCADPSLLRSLLVSELALPSRAVVVVAVTALPRTPAGKVDRPATAALIHAAAGYEAAGEGSPPRTDPTSSCAADRSTVSVVDRLCTVYAEVLDVAGVGPSSSFANLGGDSLSYVALSVRLEEELGTLPPDWHSATIAELAMRSHTRGRWARLETGVALRGAAILAVVGTHAGWFTLRGGAHVLLAVAGYNAARFTFSRQASRHALRGAVALSRIVVPSMLWIGLMAVVTGAYRPTTVLLVNGAFGPDRWGPDWHYWFIEALAWILLAVGAALALRPVRELRARWPFGFALGLVCLGLLPRFDVVEVWTGPERGTPQYIFWVFALGWAAAEASRVWQRVVVSVAALASVPGFFGDGRREAVVLVGLLAVVWLPTVAVPRALARFVGVVAGASLYIYLTQWQVYPIFDDVPVLATALSISAGVAAAAVADAGRRTARRVGSGAVAHARRAAGTDPLRRLRRGSPALTVAPGGPGILDSPAAHLAPAARSVKEIPA